MNLSLKLRIGEPLMNRHSEGVRFIGRLKNPLEVLRYALDDE